MVDFFFFFLFPPFRVLVLLLIRLPLPISTFPFSSLAQVNGNGFIAMLQQHNKNILMLVVTLVTLKARHPLAMETEDAFHSHMFKD